MRCSRCNSVHIVTRRRRLSDVLATWARYCVDFFFRAVGDNPGPMYQTSRERGFDASTPRSLATGRVFWRCRDCGERGAIFDEYVTSS